jgi:acyl-CoA thioester hydrolase
MSVDFPHQTVIRVRYADTDAMGVVYYANYLAYFEAARVEFLRAAGADYRRIEDDGVVAAVTRADCRYLLPARFDDELTVCTRVAQLGRATMRFEYEIRRVFDQALIAQGFTEHACLQKGTLRPTRLPERVRQTIESYQSQKTTVRAADNRSDRQP